MADKDENTTQVVTETDENKDQSVTGQGENTEAANQQNAEEAAQSQEQAVPYKRFKEVNDQKKKAEEDAAYSQRQLELYQQQQLQQQQQQTTQQASSTYEQAMLDVGVTADDLYDGNNVVKVQNRKEQLDNAKQMQNATFATNQQFMTNHSDFNEVVGSVNLSTNHAIWSPEALALKLKKPWLAGAFLTCEGAYNAVMQERKISELEQKATVNAEQANRQDADNSSLPLGGSAAGGGTGGDTQNQAMMSRSQVLEIRQKLASGEHV